MGQRRRLETDLGVYVSRLSIECLIISYGVQIVEWID